jgi:hypothetical protein
MVSEPISGTAVLRTHYLIDPVNARLSSATSIDRSVTPRINHTSRQFCTGLSAIKQFLLNDLRLFGSVNAKRPPQLSGLSVALAQ